MRELPIVVPAAEVLEILNGVVRNIGAGEVTNGFANGLAVGLSDFDKDAIHIKHDHIWFLATHQIRSNSSNNRWIWSRVPTVKRRYPGSS